MVTVDIPNGSVTVLFTQLIESFGFDSQITFPPHYAGRCSQSDLHA